MAEARRLVDQACKITVLTGAGISTDSGIPDFRGPNGVWTKDPEAEKTSDIAYYTTDPAVRARAWQGRVAWFDAEPQPNDGHRALVALQRRGTLHTVVTQNIDGLHQAAGIDPASVVEVHGALRDVVCLACGERTPAGPTLDRVRAGEADPECLTCGGMLKSATISFGQALVPHDWARAERAALECDLMLAVGSTLSVYPAAGLVHLAAAEGAPVVIVNGEPTELDHLATVAIHGPITGSLQALLG